jgi:hypothetical protein
MGGRGGGSGRGGGAVAATARIDREKVGQLAPDYVGYQKALQMLSKETGIPMDEVEKYYAALSSYFGSGYHAIRAGKPPSEAMKGKLIDQVIKKSRAYNGTIYRGIHLSTDNWQEWKKGLVKGGTIDMKGISSWSSKKSVAENFAGGYGNGQSVIFKVKSTSHAAPVQHLSHYGNAEAEVLAPSTVKYRITGYVTKGHTTYVDLTEVA